MLYFDTETCGFHGPIILIQYAIDDGPVILHDVWTSPFHETFELIEKICNYEGGVCGFNLAFDWFHLCQWYTTAQLVCARYDCGDDDPQDWLLEYALAEPAARDGVCLKPHGALDLMLHARKGPFQSLMDRKDIRIRRIPYKMAELLAKELTDRIKISDVYFAKRKDPTTRWQALDIHNDLGELDNDFQDVVLKFQPSSALKALCAEIGIISKNRVLMKDFSAALPKVTEYGYAPFAMAVGTPKNWHGAWPVHIGMHIQQWGFNLRARSYAEDDVHDTRGLHKYFSAVKSGLSSEQATQYALGKLDAEVQLIPAGDVDSNLACMVGAVRWHGYSIDIENIKRERAVSQAQLDAAGGNYNAIAEARAHILPYLSETERTIIGTSTKATILEEISRWKESTVCDACSGDGCDLCDEGFIRSDIPHPAAERAIEVLKYRRAYKRIEVYDKLLRAGRFHVSTVVIGARSSRMAGADGLNPQGINRSKEVRSLFPLTFPGFVVSGGDFAGFELTIMSAAYYDPRMEEELKSDTKMHTLWGSRYFFPGMSFADIDATKGLPDEQDKYGLSKNGVFAVCYFGEAHTLHTRVGIPEDVAEAAFEGIQKDYPDFAEARNEIVDKFCSMKQPGGLGTEVIWAEPAQYVESLLGFPRYYTLENQICKALFELAQRPPKEWRHIEGKIKRRDREQTNSGAVQSALYGAAFAIQGSNMRSAGNHRVQSTGAEITKEVEHVVWTFQPAGISKWVVIPMNIHDEVISLCKPEVVDPVAVAVQARVEEYRNLIPLLEIEWCKEIGSWADK